MISIYASPGAKGVEVIGKVIGWSLVASCRDGENLFSDGVNFTIQSSIQTRILQALIVQV